MEWIYFGCLIGDDLWVTPDFMVTASPFLGLKLQHTSVQVVPYSIDA